MSHRDLAYTAGRLSALLPNWLTRFLTQGPVGVIGRLLIITGVVLMLAGILFPGLPALIVPAIARPEASESTLVVLGVICLCGSLLALIARRGEWTFSPLATEGLDRARSSSLTTSGRPFGRRLHQAIEIQHHSIEYDSPSEAEIDERLRTTAIGAYRRQTGATEAAARSAVESGTWTDDPVAAVTLGDESEVAPPPRLWLRRRIDPKGAYEQEVERTAAAIKRLETDD